MVSIVLLICSMICFVLAGLNIIASIPPTTWLAIGWVIITLMWLLQKLMPGKPDK